MPDVNLELIQVTENQDGTFNVYVRGVREIDSAEINNKSFTAASVTDLKDQIRPQYVKLLADEARKKQLETGATQALVDLMSEVT